MPSAEALKDEGNNFFKVGKYAEAVEKYLAATALDPNVPAYWSNMAACYEKLRKFQEMEEASRSCIKADRTFIKGYFRLAVAQKQLGELADCIKTLESGLALDSSHKDLKQMKKEVNELLRAEQVATYCQQAEAQFSKGEISAAMKTLDLASRLDAGNASIQKLMAKVKPAFEKQEAARKKNLSKTEVLKEKGDEAYKNADFEGAITKYSECLTALEKSGQKQSELAIKVYANRAACYKQISNFDGVIADCSAVLEVEPQNVKALLRRAQAFEGVERYRFALQDVKTVLQMPYNVVGKANFDLCNGLQHRLQRTVDQLKKMSSS